MTLKKSWFKVDATQKKYGIKQIDPTDKIETIKKATAKNKKYKVKFKDGTSLNFGDTRFEQYKDRIGEFKNKNHNDKQRRKNYLTRASKIKDKSNKLTVNNIKSPNFYSTRVLW